MLLKTDLNILHVSTLDQLADLLSKPLSRQRHAQIKNNISIADGTLILWECVKETNYTPSILDIPNSK